MYKVRPWKLRPRTKCDRQISSLFSYLIMYKVQPWKLRPSDQQPFCLYPGSWFKGRAGLTWLATWVDSAWACWSTESWLSSAWLSLTQFDSARLSLAHLYSLRKVSQGELATTIFFSVGLWPPSRTGGLCQFVSMILIWLFFYHCDCCFFIIYYHSDTVVPTSNNTRYNNNMLITTFLLCTNFLLHKISWI